MAGALLKSDEGQQHRPKQKFSCLTYHIIGEGISQYTTTEAQLRAQLELLNAKEYAADGFEQLEAKLRFGGCFPCRYVVLTIDDGHESSMRAADILEAYGCKATFFLTRDRSVKKLGFLRAGEIRELRGRGFSLGTHGATHRKLTSLSDRACVEELRGSKEWLEDVIGEEVRYTAAPGGYINGRVLRLSAECGYVLTATCREWMNSSGCMKLPGAVNRVNIRQHFSSRNFHQAVEGHLCFYVWRRMRAAALAVPKRFMRG